MQIELARGDITTFACDAVVNAANKQLEGGGGVDGAIHRAGGKTIIDQCRALRATAKYRDGLPAGQAVATTAGRLPARWVIHTVGPVHAKTIDRTPLLRACYTSSLAVADELGAATVVFPLVSAGVYGWPKDDAIIQALFALRAAVTSVRTSTLMLYDQKTEILARTLF